MAASSRPAIPRDWRLVAAIGCAGFAVSFALFHYVVPVGGWIGGARASASAFARRADSRSRRWRAAILIRAQAPAGAQPAHARRARQYVARPVHVRRPSAAGRLQPPLRGDVPAAGRDRAPGHDAAARCSNTAPRTAASRATSTTIWSSSRLHGRRPDAQHGSQIRRRPHHPRHQPPDGRAAAGWRRTRTSPSGATPSASAPPCRSSSSAAP